MLTAMLAALLNGLVSLQRGHAAWGGARLALAIALVVGFVVRQRRVVTPLMQLSLYGHPVFRRAAVVAVIYGAGLFGSTYLLPVFLLAALAAWQMRPPAAHRPAAGVPGMTKRRAALGHTLPPSQNQEAPHGTLDRIARR